MYKKIVISSMVGLTLALLSLGTVQALQPYMGGYLRGSARTTSKVHLAVSFGATDPSLFHTGQFLLGIPSVAGGASLVPSGWVYQNPVSLRKDGSVQWFPQAWYLDHMVWYPPGTLVGQGNWVAFHLRMDITSHDKVTFKCYAYQSIQSYIYDTPIVYSWSNSTTDYNFIVGRQYHDIYWYKHFQFGIEASNVWWTPWDVVEKKPCYYSGGTWYYLPGYVCWGPDPPSYSSTITWLGQSPVCIGDLNYDYVYAKYTTNDFVEWNVTTYDTVPDDSVLWSGSGTVSDVVKKPYQ